MKFRTIPALVKDYISPGRQAESKRFIAMLLTLFFVLTLLVDAFRINISGPSPSYLLLDRHGEFIAEIADDGQEYGYWPVKELSERVVAALIALEDRHFGLHPGVDPVAVARAAYQNLINRKRISGASTIAMQVARLIDPGERSYWNKLKESWRALVLTAKYSRKEILAAYLRLVPYGNRIHGIGYASRRYLGKPVEDLSWAEIAYLSAIPQSPGKMNPYHADGRNRAIERGSRLLGLLHDQGLLPDAEFEIAVSQIRDISLPRLNNRSENSLHAVFKLRKLLQEGVAGSGSEPYRIFTTLDTDVQSRVASITGAALNQWQKHGAGNAAVILLDRESNEVIAWVGSTDYFSKEQAGALDYAQVLRSPGSALKPFIYALALERRLINSATILDDLPAVSEGVVNADRTFLGPLLPRQALANSRNVPVVRLLKDIGLEEGYEFLREIGLHQDERAARHYGLGISIGSMPVTLEKLVTAYSMLSNDGILRPLKWQREGDLNGRQMLSPETTRLISLYLSDPSARLPSFPRMGSTEYAFPVALKTGTSEGLRDAWTVAYSRKYLVGVWIGHPDVRPMRELTGASAGAELAHRILTVMHGEDKYGLSDLGFPSPAGYEKVAICAMTGKKAVPACDPVFEEWFRHGDEPQEFDNAYHRFYVDRRNGKIAHSGIPSKFVELRTFVSLAPRYTEWAIQAGLPQIPRELSGSALSGLSAVRQGIRQFSDAENVQSMKITTPQNGLQLLRDPGLPVALNTIGLRAEVVPVLKEILWLVDGKPFKLAAYPYSLRWQMVPGEHTFQLQSPLSGEKSGIVRIRVK